MMLWGTIFMVQLNSKCSLFLLVMCAMCSLLFFEVAEHNFCSLMLIGGSSYTCISRIPVKIDRNAFWSATEAGFRSVD
jgi:hypothetical protein